MELAIISLSHTHTRTHARTQAVELAMRYLAYMLMGSEPGPHPVHEVVFAAWQVCVIEREREREGRCVCVCVCERENEREREGKKASDRLS